MRLRSRPVILDRTLQQRVVFTTALRAGNHAALAARAVGYNGRSRRWLAVAAASIGIDAIVARLLADPAYLPGWPQRLVEWLDTATWTFATEDHHDVVPLLTTGSLAAVAEATLAATAGDEAVPVYDSRQPWPPRDVGDAARRAGRVLAAGAVPAVLAGVIRRRRGLPDSGLRHLVLTAAGVVLVVTGARHRERLHRGERRRWAERTAAHVDHEFAAAQAALAMRSSPGHDFKKTLVALALHGSRRARAEAHHQGDRPGLLAAELDGTTLFEVTRSTRIEPPEAATLWLSPAQAAAVDGFLARAEEEAVDGADHTVRVSHPSERVTVIDHLGLTLPLHNDPPPLQALLYPTAPALSIAAFLASDNAMSGELPVAAVAPPTFLLTAMAWRFWQRPPTDDELDGLVVGVVAAAAMGFAVCASPLATDYRGAFPANPFIKGSLILLGSHWGRLAPRHKLAVPLLVGGWLAASLHRRRRDPTELVVAVIEVVQAVAAGWRFTDLVDAEANHLEAVLQAEFTAACDAARRRATAGELARYRSQLRLARSEIAALEALDPAEPKGLEGDCDELEAWLDDQERALAGRPG